MVIDPVRMNRLEETATLVEAITSQSSQDQMNLLDEQQKVLAIFQQQILGTCSLEEIAAIKKIIAPIAPTINAIRNTKASYSLDSSSKNTPNNKKIEPQRRLFTTKKKRKAQVRPVVSSDEQDILAVQLLND